MHRELMVTRAVLVSLFMTPLVSTGIFNRYSRGDGGSCNAKAVVFNLILPSTVSCAFKCRTRKECKNINYIEETRSCIGCRETCESGSISGGPSDGQCWKKDEHASDCLEHTEKFKATKEGVYRIKTKNDKEHDVFCLKNDSSGPPEWTVFLRRINESLAFDRTFLEYDDGFGDVRGSHWKGLKFLNEMTTNRSTEVLFKFHIPKHPFSEGHQIFSNFQVGLGPRYRSTVGKELAGGIVHNTCFEYSNNSDFSTKERDFSGSECSSKHSDGGWWWNKDCLGPSATERYTNIPIIPEYMSWQPGCVQLRNADKITIAFRITNRNL